MAAVFEKQPHTGNAGLVGVTLVVVVAVGVDLAQHQAPVAEHTGQHLHGSPAFVAELGQRAGAARLRPVDTVALQRTRAHPQPVAQRQQRAVGHRAHVEHQCRANTTLGLRQGGLVQPGATVEPGTARQVGKTQRQLVTDADAAQQLAADVFDADAVVDKLAQLHRFAAAGFFDEKAGAWVSVQRDVQMHRRGLRCDGEGLAVRAGVHRAFGRQQVAGQGRREAVVARRHHPQLVNAGRHQRKAVLPVGAGGQHAGRAGQAVGHEDPRLATRLATVAAPVHVNQRQHGAGQRGVGLAVKHHAKRVNQHTGLQQRGAAASHRNQQLVIGAHAQLAVTTHHRQTPGVLCGHVGVDAESAGVGAGLGGQERF